jgi:predicted nucleotidyltransferase
MLKELLKNTKFRSITRDFYAQNQESVIDVLVFGSAVRGKEKPADIDLLILCRNKAGTLDLGNQLRIALGKKGFKASITSKTYESLFDPAFTAREAFLSEAYSLVLDRFISKGLGYEPVILFRYALKGMSKSERMRFYYGLHGRNSDGVLKLSGARKFSETIIAAPIERSEEIRAFLDHWKTAYLEIPALIPARILQARNL